MQKESLGKELLKSFDLWGGGGILKSFDLKSLGLEVRPGHENVNKYVC